MFKQNLLTESGENLKGAILNNNKSNNKYNLLRAYYIPGI